MVGWLAGLQQRLSISPIPGGAEENNWKGLRQGGGFRPDGAKPALLCGLGGQNLCSIGNLDWDLQNRDWFAGGVFWGAFWCWYSSVQLSCMYLYRVQAVYDDCSVTGWSTMEYEIRISETISKLYIV